MNALIIKHTRINPYQIEDEDEYCELWAATEWLIKQNPNNIM